MGMIAALRDSLEYFWVTGNEEHTLVLPMDETPRLSTFFSKRVGADQQLVVQCSLELYGKRLYLICEGQVAGILHLTMDVVFEITSTAVCGKLRLEKDQCECEFETTECSSIGELLSAWQEEFSRTLTQKHFQAHYDVKKLIGSGAHASVFIAERKSDQKQFAVKSLSKAHIFSSLEGKAEIETELEVMREVRHHNVMRLFEVFDTESSIKIVLELLRGGSLSDLLKKSPQLTWMQICIIMQQILSGLKALHEKGIMHRDLKPENILLRQIEEIDLVIADYGLSTYQNAQRYIYLKCGTPGYVAPEVINLPESITKYSVVCDIFSAGAIFFKLCFQKPLFSGKSHAEVLSENKQVIFSMTAADERDLPAEALDLLKRMIEKDPIKRITAAEALSHSFFKDFMHSKSAAIHSQPLRSSDGGGERVKSYLQLDRQRNTETSDSSSSLLKSRRTIITGKIKTSLPTSQMINSPTSLSSGLQTSSRRGSSTNIPSFGSLSGTGSTASSPLAVGGGNQIAARVKRMSHQLVEERRGEVKQKMLNEQAACISRPKLTRNMLPSLTTIPRQPQTITQRQMMRRATFQLASPRASQDNITTEPAKTSLQQYNLSSASKSCIKLRPLSPLQLKKLQQS